MRTCAAIVTYGDRLGPLARTLDAVLAQGASHVIVVLNGASGRVRDYVETIEDSRVEIRDTGRNLGSAGGFAVALATAAAGSADAVWLLDDDNIPAQDALAHLVEESERNFERAMCSLRPDDVKHRQLLSGVPVDEVFDTASSAIGFDLRRSLRRWGRPSAPLPQIGEPKPILVPHAPWGGLWLPLPLVRRTAPPRLDLVLYQEDVEYTSRLPGQVLLIPASVVYDPDRRNSGPPEEAPLTDPMRLYYSVRNWLYFDKLRARSAGTRAAFALNCVLVVAKLLRRSLSDDPGGALARAVALGVMDAFSGRLGERRYAVPQWRPEPYRPPRRSQTNRGANTGTVS